MRSYKQATNNRKLQRGKQLTNWLGTTKARGFKRFDATDNNLINYAPHQGRESSKNPRTITELPTKKGNTNELDGWEGAGARSR